MTEQQTTLLQAILLELKCISAASRATAASFAPMQHEGESILPSASDLAAVGLKPEDFDYPLSAWLQIAQALASEVLRGEEFSAIAESAPRLMRAVADGMGLSIGALRKLAEEGKLTSEALATALQARRRPVVPVHQGAEALLGELVAEVRGLRAEVQALRENGAGITKLLQRWEDRGMPPGHV